MLHEKFQDLLNEVNIRFGTNLTTEEEVIDICNSNGFEYQSDCGHFFISRNKESGELGSGYSRGMNDITEYRTILSADKLLSEIDKMVTSLISSPMPNDENVRMFRYFDDIKFMTTQYEYELKEYDEFVVSFTQKDAEKLYDIYKDKDFLEKSKVSNLVFQIDKMHFNALCFNIFWTKFLEKFTDTGEKVAITETLKLLDYIDKMSSLQYHMRREVQALFQVDELYARKTFGEIKSIVSDSYLLQKNILKESK